jgi:hypothetical protein
MQENVTKLPLHMNWGGGHFTRLFTERISLNVPDQFFQAGYVQSYVEHDWSLIGSIRYAVSLRQHRVNSATIVIAPGVWVQRHAQPA